MKLTVRTYRYDISQDSHAKLYNELTEKLKGIGYNKFDVHNTSNYQAKQDYLKKIGGTEFELDDGHLFAEQFNTKALEGDEKGFRFHLWYAYIYPNKKIKEGYFIDFDYEQYKRLLDNRFECGFCATQYSKEDAEKLNHTCNSCLGSEYLKFNQTYLLELKAISDKTDRTGSNTDKDLFDMVQSEAYKERQAVAREKYLKCIKQTKDDAIQKATDTFRVRNFLAHKQFKTPDKGKRFLTVGELKNIIYYNHSHTISFNWSSGTEISEADFKCFCESLNQDDFELLGSGVTLSLKDKIQYTQDGQH